MNKSKPFEHLNWWIQHVRAKHMVKLKPTELQVLQVVWAFADWGTFKCDAKHTTLMEFAGVKKSAFYDALDALCMPAQDADGTLHRPALLERDAYRHRRKGKTIYLLPLVETQQLIPGIPDLTDAPREKSPKSPPVMSAHAEVTVSGCPHTRTLMSAYTEPDVRTRGSAYIPPSHTQVSPPPPSPQARDASQGGGGGGDYSGGKSGGELFEIAERVQAERVAWPEKAAGKAETLAALREVGIHARDLVELPHVTAGVVQDVAAWVLAEAKRKPNSVPAGRDVMGRVVAILRDADDTAACLQRIAAAKDRKLRGTAADVSKRDRRAEEERERLATAEKNAAIRSAFAAMPDDEIETKRAELLERMPGHLRRMYEPKDARETLSWQGWITGLVVPEWAKGDSRQQANSGGAA